MATQSADGIQQTSKITNNQQPIEAKLSNSKTISVANRVRLNQKRSISDGANSRGSDELSVASWTPTVAIGSRSDALDALTGGDLVAAAGEKKYMLVKKKPKYKKVKMEVFEPKMKYKKIKMKVPVKMMKKKKVKGYMVKKEHEHHGHY